VAVASLIGSADEEDSAQKHAKITKMGKTRQEHPGRSVSFHFKKRTSVAFLHERVSLFEPGVCELFCDFATVTKADYD
jgi:hypothetical protein